jgi:RNA-directed DNA polymerase
MRGYRTKDVRKHAKTRRSSPVLEITKQEEENINPLDAVRWKLGVKVGAWTDRMLAALVNGVKGRKWFSLIDKINTHDTLYASWEMVKYNQGAAGVDKVTVEKVAARPIKYLEEIENEIKGGTYQPAAIRRVYIPKGEGKTRPLGIPTVKDRIVQGAIKLIIEPIYEQEFSEASYGFRPNRSCKDALRVVDQYLKAGYTWVVDADLQSYFDTIPHDKLMDRIREKIADGKVLTLIEQFLKAKIMEDFKEWETGSGTPQGGVLSPLLSNIYLHPLDKLMEEKGVKMIRYADDFVLLCKTKEEATRAYEYVKAWIEENKLILHPEKTHIGDASQPGQGFEFLGFRFENGKRFVRKKSLNKLKDKVRLITKRNSGYSMDKVISKLNLSLKGWFQYFKPANPWIFGRIDSWIRRRLRAVLKRRMKKNGLGRTQEDHQTWPNKHFAEMGLFSLKAAREQAVKTIKTVKAC